jgi:hypothetical protein
LKTATFYVQLEPRWRSWKDHKTGKFPLESVAATRVTQTRPGKPKVGSITVKLSVNIPDSVFEPFEPVVEINIPEPVEDMIQVNVEAVETEELEDVR